MASQFDRVTHCNNYFVSNHIKVRESANLDSH
jgi:hypothetical protein